MGDSRCIKDLKKIKHSLDNTLSALGVQRDGGVLETYHKDIPTSYGELTKLTGDLAVKSFFEQMMINSVSLEVETYGKDTCSDSDLLYAKVKPCDTTLQNCFLNCTFLFYVEELDVSNTNSLKHLFRNCTRLKHIENIENWDFSAATNMSCVFYECANLEADWEHLNWYAPNCVYFDGLFYGSKMSKLNPSFMNNGKCSTLSQTFTHCYYLEEFTTDLVISSSLKSLYGAFSGCWELRRLNTSDWDVSSVTTFNNTFYECKKLTELDVSKWNTASAVTFASIFARCESLKSIDVSGFILSKATDISSMFRGCSYLETINCENWDTSKVSRADAFCQSTKRLESLDLSKWDTSSLINIQGFFRYNSQSIDVKWFAWTGENVIIDYVYNGSNPNMDYSRWFIKPKYSMRAFASSSLKTIKIGCIDFINWIKYASANNGIFYGSTALTDIEGEFKNIKDSECLQIEKSPLTRDSALVVINGLYDYSEELGEEDEGYEIQFSQTTCNNLLDEDFELAFAKGWTITTA